MQAIHALLLTAGTDVDRAQVYPFYEHKDELRRQLYFTFDQVEMQGAGNVRSARYAGAPTAVFVQSRCMAGMALQAKIKFLNGLRRRSKVVVLDSSASTYAKDFTLLPYVDLYVRKSLFKDLALHRNRYLDGRVYSDYLIRKNGLKPTFKGTIILDRRYSRRLILGWNIGTKERVLELLSRQNQDALVTRTRKIDISCRIRTEVTPFRAWYSVHRRSALHELNKLAGAYNVRATDAMLPKDRYLDELRDSKITVSPFGWGEICIRDFEAVVAGSLLIKPSMQHLRTLPDIYRNRKTYVAVQWDFSDLGESCVHYLENEAVRGKIAANALREYARYSKGRMFLQKMKEILDRLRLRE